MAEAGAGLRGSRDNAYNLPPAHLQWMHLKTSASQEYHRTMWLSRKFGKKDWN